MVPGVGTTFVAQATNDREDALTVALDGFVYVVRRGVGMRFEVLPDRDDEFVFDDSKRIERVRPSQAMRYVKGSPDSASRWSLSIVTSDD